MHSVLKAEFLLAALFFTFRFFSPCNSAPVKNMYVTLNSWAPGNQFTYDGSFCDPQPLSITVCVIKPTKEDPSKYSPRISIGSSEILLRHISRTDESVSPGFCYIADSCDLWDSYVTCDPNPIVKVYFSPAAPGNTLAVSISSSEVEYQKLNRETKVKVSSVTSFAMRAGSKQGLCANLTRPRYIVAPPPSSPSPQPICQEHPSRSTNGPEANMMITYIPKDFNGFENIDTIDSLPQETLPLVCRFSKYDPAAPWGGSLPRASYATMTLFITLATYIIGYYK